jgi:hypothetical protein
MRVDDDTKSKQEVVAFGGMVSFLDLEWIDTSRPTEGS